MLTEILNGLVSLGSDPNALALSAVGVLLGIVLGALPGISSTMSLAVLLPLSFAMRPHHAMMFLMGVFSASVFGGSISAILINIPGTPGSIVTQLDGHPMAKKGRAGEALTYAALASAFGGIVGWLLLVTIAPLVAAAALHIQSPEYAAVTVFGLTMLAYAAPGSTFKAIIGGILGLLLATVGRDAITDVSRFDFGNFGLQGGLSIIPVAVGIFGMAEVLRNIEGGAPPLTVVMKIKRLMPPFSEVRRLWPMALRGSFIGALVGAIPAAGSAIGVAVAYAQEKRMSKHPERYGTGIPEGIVAPEASNNACVGGALIPMMTLGIPGDSMTAVLVGALLIHGLRPGPALFEKNVAFVAAVYVALLFAIVFTTIFALAGARLFARILHAPKNLLVTAISVFCVIGSYAVRNSMFDVLVMIGSGVVGYLMYQVRMPVAPVVFGLVLGPLLEDNIRRTLIVNGSWTVFYERPISLVLLLLSVAALVFPVIRDRLSRRRERGGTLP
jgi:putative tricarboxylic transport membrane protein